MGTSDQNLEAALPWVQAHPAEICNNVLRNFRVIQRRAAELLGVDGWEISNIQDLRRADGTRLADVVPMHVLQRWMRHSDVSVAARFYLG